MSAVDARRRAAKLKAVPKWADSKAIKRIYWEARLLRRVFRADVEVDHIVPLQGRHVCGLHWEENLQIVFKKVNRIKSNRFTN
jgi:5-methylcytosine-specific restriction endonuclease McrA